MPIKIPQNVDKEDKLVGPLTLKQFLYLLGGSAFIFVTYQYHIQGYLFFAEFIAISFVWAAMAVSLAFAKINGRPFVTFVATALTYATAPKRRLWHRDNILPPTVRVGSRRRSEPSATSATKDTSQSRIEQLAHILDTGGRINTENASDSSENNPQPPADYEL